MKRTLVRLSFLFFLSVYFTSFLQAQAPQAFSYQTIIRDQEGREIKDQKIGMEVTIRSGSSTGLVVYQETFSKMTNSYGLFYAEIGRGTPQTGASFSQIDWGNGTFFLEIGIDPDGKTSYDLSSTNTMLSVPYALFAEHANELDGNPTNELQTLTMQGNQLTISDGNTVTLPTGSGSDNWGSQTVQTNATLTGNGTAASPLNLAAQGAAAGQVLKWNGSAWLPASDNGPDNWGSQSALTSTALTGNGTTASPLNLAAQGAAAGQVLKWNGAAWLPADDIGSTGGDGWGAQVAKTNPSKISGDGSNAAPLSIAANAIGSFEIADGSVGSAEIGDGSIGSIDLVPGLLKTYTAGAGITVVGTVISASDPSPTNELQTLSYDSTAQQLSISGGNAIKINGLSNLWKQQGLDLLPSNSSLGVNIPSGNLRGGGTSGWQLQNGGSLYLFKPNGTGTNIALGGTTGLVNNGGISIFNQSGKQVVYEHADYADAGRLAMRGPDGNTTIGLFGHAFGSPSEGEVHLFSNNEPVASLFAESGVGNLELAKADGKLLVKAEQSGLDANGGAIRVYSNDAAVARLYANNGNGELLISKSSGSTLVTAGNGGPNVGSVTVWASNETPIGQLYGCGHQVGILTLNSLSGKQIIDLGHTDGDHLENGFMGVYNKKSLLTAVAGFYTDDTSSTVYSNYIEASEAYFMNKVTKEWRTTIWDDANGGFLIVRNSKGGSPRVSLFVNSNDKGVVAADKIFTTDLAVTGVKNFHIQHPRDPSKEIWYACVEGPEAAAYERGSAHLQNGETFVPFSEHFAAIINPATVTVQLTAQSTDTYGLAVVEKTATGFRVKELKGGTGNFSFDWEVKAVRTGYEGYQPVRPFVPSIQPDASKEPAAHIRPKRVHEKE